MNLKRDNALRNIEQDKLSLKDKVKVVADIILDEDPPLRIGIFGEWGSGKSSFMNFVEEELANRNPSNGQPLAAVIKFNAWEYQHSDNILYSLVAHIATAKKNKAVPIGMAKAALAVGMSLLKECHLDVKEMVENYKDLEKTYLKKLSASYMEIEKFKSAYRRLETSILKTIGAPDGRLVVFMDDLDRCKPENLLRMLEAMKNFAAGEKTVFVVGIDPRVAGAAVKAYYGNYEPFDGQEFLEKTFDFTFRLLTWAFPNINGIAEPFDLGSDINMSNLVGTFRFHNPRKVKKVLRRFEMILTKAEQEMEPKTWLIAKTVFFLLILHEFYPGILQRLAVLDQARAPSLLTRLYDYFQQRIDNREEEMAQISGEYMIDLNSPPYTQSLFKSTIRSLHEFLRSDVKSSKDTEKILGQSLLICRKYL
jgi:hypothetical protein